jgi:hypothetical protein
MMLRVPALFVKGKSLRRERFDKMKYFWIAKVKLHDGRSATVNGDIDGVVYDLGRAERQLRRELLDKFFREEGVGCVSDINVEWKKA